MSLLFGAFRSLSGKKLRQNYVIVCKPLLILFFMAEIKAFLSYTKVQKWSTLVAKMGVAHAYQDCIDAKFQVSVQINEVLLYNKK